MDGVFSSILSGGKEKEKRVKEEERCLEIR